MRITHLGLAAPAQEPFLRAMFGTLFLLVVLRLVERFVFGPGYYAGLALHPFWIVVILAAAQRGLFVGVTTAALAGLLMEWPTRSLDTAIDTYYAELAVLPVLWILSAVFIGTFRQMQIAEETRLRDENRRLHVDNALIAEEVARQDKAVFALELAAATRTTDGGAALAALADLGCSDPAQMTARLESAARLLTPRPGRVQLTLPQEGTLVHKWGQAAAISSRRMPLPGEEARVVPLIGRTGEMHFVACAPVRGAGAPGWVAIIAKDPATAETERAVAAVLAQALESAVARSVAVTGISRPRQRTTV